MSRILVVVPHADELAFHVGGTIAAQVRSEAVERGAAYGLDYAEVLRHLSAGEGVLT